MFIRSGYSAQTRSVGSGTEHHHHAADVVRGGGDLPAARIGRSFRVRTKDLEHYVGDQFTAAG